MRAVVLAGGKGTRLRPLTDRRPKPLVPFLGEPFAAGLLRRLAAVGTRTVTFLIAQDPAPYGVLEPLAAELGVRLDVTTEERPLDTAGAARRVLRGDHDGPALVLNGDVLTDLDLAALVEDHRRRGAVATLALTHVADTSPFGVVVCDADGRVRRFVEKPPPGTVDADTVSAGTYVVAPGAFDAFPGDGPLSFERDVFPGLLAAGALLAGHPSGAFWADLGTPDRYLDGTRAVLEGRCRWPLSPAMVAAGDRALVHSSAGVEGAVLSACVVGAGCRLAPGAELRDAVLFPDARVAGGATVLRAIVGAGARIGRAARVGPGAVVADGETVPPGVRLP